MDKDSMRRAQKRSASKEGERERGRRVSFLHFFSCLWLTLSGWHSALNVLSLFAFHTSKKGMNDWVSEKITVGFRNRNEQ
jgi:hypothetical protein